jgi:hypothetical protein
MLAAAAAAAEILLRTWLQLGLGLPTGSGPNNSKHKMTPATYKLKAAFMHRTTTTDRSRQKHIAQGLQVSWFQIDSR